MTHHYGNPDGTPVDTSSHERFFHQARISLTKWPTDENLKFWMETAVETFSEDVIKVEAVLDAISVSRRKC